MCIDERKQDQLRPMVIEISPIKYAECSAATEMGNTKVLCTTTIEDGVPPFLCDSGTGSEDSMPPSQLSGLLTVAEKSISVLLSKQKNCF